MTDKDINLKITVRNARLLEAIRESYPSMAAFGRATGINIHRINELVGLRRRPVYKNGDWTDLARDVSAALGRYPDEIWPDHLREIQAQRSTAEMSVAIDELPRLRSTNMSEARRLLCKWSSQLAPRDAKVLRLRFEEGATLDEIAALENASRERIRQIEYRALREMRKKALKDRVRGLNDVDGVLEE